MANRFWDGAGAGRRRHLHRLEFPQIHPDTLLARFDLAKNLLYQGLYRAAEHEFQRVLEARRRILGDEHPRTLTARRSLAMALHALAEWDEAQAQYEVVSKSRKELLGAEHPHTLSARFNLAILRRHRGDFEGAFQELADIHALQVENSARITRRP